MLNIKDLILINRYVQGIESIETLNGWFAERDGQGQKDAVRELLSLVIQAHPLGEELDVAVDASGVKRTSTAAVMLTNPSKDYLKFGWEVTKLSGKELRNAWLILLELLKIADTRRRLSEDPAACNHWWHRDLSDSRYVKKLLKEDNV